jgi:hypothetical protein
MLFPLLKFTAGTAFGNATLVGGQGTRDVPPLRSPHVRTFNDPWWRKRYSSKLTMVEDAEGLGSARCEAIEASIVVTGASIVATPDRPVIGRSL